MLTIDTVGCMCSAEALCPPMFIDRSSSAYMSGTILISSLKNITSGLAATIKLIGGYVCRTLQSSYQIHSAGNRLVN